MLIIRKIEKGHYVLVQKCEDDSERFLSDIKPSDTNKRQYDALIFGELERFRTIADWKKWCANTYGKGCDHRQDGSGSKGGVTVDIE